MSERVVVEYEKNGVLIRCPAIVTDWWQESDTGDQVLRITFSDMVEMVQIPKRLEASR